LTISNKPVRVILVVVESGAFKVGEIDALLILIDHGEPTALKSAFKSHFSA
jgi:hypothetical protein